MIPVAPNQDLSVDWFSLTFELFSNQRVWKEGCCGSPYVEVEAYRFSSNLLF
jgi:hypothetical protein